MNAKTQIIVLTFSYLFGFIFNYLNILNINIIKNKNKFYRSFITIMFMYNIVLIYLISLYKLNHGIFHIYFLIMIILGYFTAKKFTQKMSNNKKIKNLIAKISQKWYTKAK